MGWEILFFISAYVLYKWFGNPNYKGTASWFQRDDEIRANKWIVIVSVAVVFFIYGLVNLTKGAYKLIVSFLGF